MNIGKCLRWGIGATSRYGEIGESSEQLRKWMSQADTNVTDLIARV
jgi:hypothetical protein